jgi:hypothetical protein
MEQLLNELNNPNNLKSFQKLTELQINVPYTITNVEFMIQNMAINYA